MPDTPSSQANITIYHNPKCGTSRNVLAMIQNSGEEPNVVEYLKTPLNAEQLQALVHKLGIPVRDLLRQKGTPYDELGLGEAHWTDEQLIEQMATHPILMNRPVVVTPLGAKLCRPSEAVLDILPNAQQGGFTKEDGEVVVPGKQPNA
jgi:arsenate reductase (glutaredoxin)